MKPIKKEWCNVTFAADQPEYLPLPAHIDKKNGVVTSCWKLSFKERLKAFFRGEMSVQVLTLNKPLQPIRLWFE